MTSKKGEFVDSIWPEMDKTYVASSPTSSSSGHQSPSPNCDYDFLDKMNERNQSPKDNMENCEKKDEKMFLPQQDHSTNKDQRQKYSPESPSRGSSREKSFDHYKGSHSDDNFSHDKISTETIKSKDHVEDEKYEPSNSRRRKSIGSSDSEEEARRKKDADRKRRSTSRDRRDVSKSESGRSDDRRRRYARTPERNYRSKRQSSRSPRRYRERDRSPIRDRRRSYSRERYRDRRRRSRSRDYESRRKNSRRSRSRSYERRRYRQRPSHDRYKRQKRSSSRSRSRTPPSKKQTKVLPASTSSKVGTLPLSTTTGVMTPQMALQQTMAAMSAKAQALTGIELPKYYNPAAVNPLKYAEQVQKRKLLWQNKDTEKEEQPKGSVWDKTKFQQDDDGKMTAKFRKLMGIKAEGGALSEGETEIKPEAPLDETALQQEELFRNLGQQYEVARMSTHTHRGVGLGYSAQTIFPPMQRP